MRGPTFEKLRLDIGFDPKQPVPGQKLKIIIGVKNRNNAFKKAGLSAIFKSGSKLDNEYQNVDVIGMMI